MTVKGMMLTGCQQFLLTVKNVNLATFKEQLVLYACLYIMDVTAADAYFGNYIYNISLY